MHNQRGPEAPAHPLKERKNVVSTLQAPEKRPASKQPLSKKAHLHRPQDTCADKENRAATNEGSGIKYIPGYLKATVSSRGKTDPKEAWKSTMEKELAGLQGTFDSLKRESFRASICQANPTEEGKGCVVPPSPAGSSLAARLQALKRESSQLLEGAASKTGVEARPSSTAGPGQLTVCHSAKALLPTTRENIHAACDHRSSFSDLMSFDGPNHWETPSLAQVAEELFSDSAFAEMCERGLTMQLKRTKDGATAESRIAELAGVYKIYLQHFRISGTCTTNDMHLIHPLGTSLVHACLPLAEQHSTQVTCNSVVPVCLCRAGQIAEEVPEPDVDEDPFLHRDMREI
jgi:hypothetical protein